MTDEDVKVATDDNTDELRWQDAVTTVLAADNLVIATAADNDDVTLTRLLSSQIFELASDMYMST